MLFGAGYGGNLRSDTVADLFEIAEAEVRNVGASVVRFVAVDTLGLELAQFGGAFVEDAMGLSAGAIYGQLDFGRGFQLHGIEYGVGFEKAFFDPGAAAESPHGAADFLDEVVFEDAFGREILDEDCVDLGIESFFAGTDEVVEVAGWGCGGHFRMVPFWSRFVESACQVALSLKALVRTAIESLPDTRKAYDSAGFSDLRR